MKNSALLAILGPGLALAGPVVKCADVPATSFGPEVKIESAVMTTATAKVPEHCDVRGTIWPENKFALTVLGAVLLRYGTPPEVTGDQGMFAQSDPAALAATLTTAGFDAVNAAAVTVTGMPRPAPWLAKPTADCHTTRFCIPAGTPLISNEPSF